MRSRIDFIANRFKQNLQESGTEVTLVWNIWPANASVDPVTLLSSGTPEPMRERVPAFLHFVNATAAVRQFNEIQVGDCIADFAAELVLVGRADLSFLLPTGPSGALESWTNKPISSVLSAYWDTMQSGRRLCQTVLLRKAT